VNIFNLKEYAENCLNITTKQAQLKKLKFNSFQNTIHNEIIRQRKHHGRVRVIILKARQLGVSTFSTAYLFHQAITHYYRSGLIISHDSDSTRGLFDICKRYWDFLPGIKPLRKRSNARELLFDNPFKDRDGIEGLMSAIKLETAGKKTAGRSSTIHDLHVSELPYFENAATVMSGLLQSVPQDGSSIIIEGTAQGITGAGEEFYIRWKKAEEGSSDFAPLFFAAHKNPEYKMSLPEDFVTTEWENMRLATFPEMTKEYLMFRRYKIANDLGSALMSAEDQFRQEYPDTPSESFISSGRSVFSIDKITAYIEKIKSTSFECFEI